MTTLSLPRPSSGSALRAVVSFFANIFAGIEEGRAIRNRYDRLSRLSASELERLGLDRSTIAQAAARGLPVR